MGVMVWIGISAVSSATLAPLVCALLTPRLVNAKAAIVGALVGEGVYVNMYLISKKERSVMAAGAWGVIASFIALYVVALILKPKQKNEDHAPIPE
jgi:Na+/proline symporter